MTPADPLRARIEAMVVIQSHGEEFKVRFTVGVQSFDIGYATDEKDSVEFMQRMFVKALTKVVQAERHAEAREIAKALKARYPRAHTYASENADVYRAHDDAINKAIQFIEQRIAEGGGR